MYYTKDGGATWNLIKTLDGNSGTWTWVVSPLGGSKSRCKVKVGLVDAQENTLGTDVSDTFFTIQASL